MIRWRGIGAIAGLALALIGCHRTGKAVPSPTGADTIAATRTADPGYVAEDPRLTALVGQPGPAVRLAGLDGRTVDIGSSAPRKPIYLKLWATYCIPCRAQMPGFAKSYQSLGGRIDFVAVNAGVGDDAAKVRRFVAANGLRMPVALDDGGLSAWLKMRETPLHLVIGRDGRIVNAGHRDGPPLDAALRRAVAQLEPGGTVAPVKVQDPVAVQPGQMVPTFHLLGPGGERMTLVANGLGKRRALLFTAVWCEDYLRQTEPDTAAGCRSAREEVDRASPGGGTAWLGVASHMWTTPRDVANYRTKTRQRIPYGMDDNGAAFRLFGIHRFPAVVLIDAQGHLVKIVGPDQSAVRAAIRTAAALDASDRHRPPPTAM